MLGKLKHTCLVTGCTNSNEVGTGMLIDANNPDEKEHVFGFICSPCWKAVITGKCRNSKLSENIVKYVIDDEVAAFDKQQADFIKMRLRNANRT